MRYHNYRLKSKRIKQNIANYVMLFPAIAYILIFSFYPIFSGVIMSFNDVRITGASTFNGVANYEKVFADPAFWSALKNTFIFAFWNCFYGVFLSLAVAILLNEVRRTTMKKFIQTVIYLPNLLSWVVVGSSFVFLLSPTVGPVNQVLKSMGHEAINFFSEIGIARGLIIFINQWKITGYGVVIYLAALVGISQDQYEAAILDGAGRFEQIWYVTIPNLKNTILTMVMLNVTGMFQLFDPIYVLGNRITQGREKRVYPRIGAIIETPGFYPNLTGTENLEIFAKLRGTAAPNAVKNALEIVGLPYRDKKLFSKYSLGMKQRLGIANAILHDPELLILDEPTNGLDPIGIAEVRDFIKTLSIERGKTILISSHILSEIALLADDIGIIDHGVLLEENSMNELQKKNSKYILLQVSDIPKTSLVLERQFGVTEYSVQDEHTLRIYDTSLDMAAVNKALVVQDISVISSQLCNDTLEDYFKKITGGEGIA